MSEAVNLLAIRAYWNTHIHDLDIATAPAGSAEFFSQLAAYRYNKLHYLPRLVNFDGFAGQRLLEVGCGIGIDLVRFAAGGAHVTGIDLSETALDLARANFAQHELSAELEQMNGEAMAFHDNQFDVVYAHGVLQYTIDPRRMLAEIHRVLRPGGQAILMVYNKYSWLSALAIITPADLEHVDAPGFATYSSRNFRSMLTAFSNVNIIPERFPVKTQLHGGLQARLYNDLFVGTFNALPQPLVRWSGWHLMAFADK
ncbi:MAG: class I SAM-dependent methyltransferase [Anaerolineae bacterium]|nr:class I SAM-dependent methyltransferase [Anaerolineae bacterium]